MSRWSQEIRRRLADANLDPGRESEVAQELEQHLEDRYQEARNSGCSEEAAAAVAWSELRDHTRMRADLAAVGPAWREPLPPGDPHAGSWLGDRLMDVRYALRLLRRTPGFTAVAVLTLALGIGATVAIASAAYAVLYRPLPVPGVERLVVPVSVNPGRGIERGSVPFADYADWREQADVFDGVALFSPIAVDIAGDGAPERIQAVQVTSDYFRTIAVAAQVGRVLAADDYEADAASVVLISDTLWKRRFGGDPAAVGRDLRIAGNAARIIGVVPASQLWPAEQDAWLPLRPSTLDDDVRTRRDNMIFLSVAKLSPGVELTQARGRVAAIAQRVAQERPESRTGWSSNLIPLREYIVDPEVRLGMFVLLGGVALVLLIACVNLANLLLARGADRVREIALRAALGASRRRLIRQLLMESAVLALIGGAAGLVLAGWLLHALKGAAPAALPMAETMTLDAVAIAAALAVTVLSAVLFGTFPAVAVSGHEPVETLKESGRSGGPGRATGRIRDALVVAQMALAIVLLVGAGLMVRSVGGLMRVHPGLDVDRILAGRVALPGARYTSPQRVQFYEWLTQALATSPGVESAAATSYLPAGGRGFGLGRVFLVEGQPEPPSTADHPAMWNVVTPEYFRTVGIPLVRGRTFTAQDTADGVPVMIINQLMARRVFGDTDPIGRRMRSWRDENLLREIVGVVADVRYDSLADDDRSLVYVPHAQNAWGSMTVVVRARHNPAALAETLRGEVARIDPDVAVARVRPLTEIARESIASHRFGAVLIALFALAATVLAGTGVYGVMSYAVSNRRHEFGVRLALGAAPPDLFWMVIRRGFRLALIGAVIGLGGGLALAPAIRTLLFGVRPFDPATLTLVPLILLIVAFVACALPGRRAARTEPLEALRD